MSTTEEPQVTEEHRELLEMAKQAIYGGGSVGNRIDEVRDGFAALVQLAFVADKLNEIAVHGRGRDVGDGEIDYKTFLQTTPMQQHVATAICAHDRELERLWQVAHRRVCDLEQALKAAVCQLTGQEEGSDFPTLHALKQLDLATETEEVDK